MRREANIRMADDEPHRDLKKNKRRPKVGCNIRHVPNPSLCPPLPSKAELRLLQRKGAALTQC